jgi:hypothetical protein
MRYNTRAALITVLSAAALAALTAASVPAGAAPAAPGRAAVIMTDPEPDPAPDITPDITARPLCEVNGSGYCGRDQGNSGATASPLNNALDNAGPAENTKWVPDGGHFTWNGHAYPTGVLKLTGHPGLCWGNLTAGFTELTTDCANGTGRIIGHGISNGHDVWVLRAETQENSTLMVLGSDDIFGDTLYAADWRDSGSFKRWSF